MDFYDYIAGTNPHLTASVIESYGYILQNDDIASCARDFVNNEGEGALRKLCAIHPDRELILSYFGGEEGPSIQRTAPVHAPVNPQPFFRNDMMLVFLMGATLLITAAIITK